MATSGTIAGSASHNGRLCALGKAAFALRENREGDSHRSFSIMVGRSDDHPCSCSVFGPCPRQVVTLVTDHGRPRSLARPRDWIPSPIMKSTPRLGRSCVQSGTKPMPRPPRRASDKLKIAAIGYVLREARRRLLHEFLLQITRSLEYTKKYTSNLSKYYKFIRSKKRYHPAVFINS